MTDDSLTPPKGENDYELRFRSLVDEERAYAFPCDARGRVQLDLLSERALNNYLYARAVVGRELSSPSVHLKVAG